MKHLRIYFILFFIAHLSCYGQDNWQTYKCEDGHFKVDFKGSPENKIDFQEYVFSNLIWNVVVFDKGDNFNLSYLVKYANILTKTMTSDSLRLLQEFFFLTQNDLSSKNCLLDKIYVRNIQQYPGREYRWIDKNNNIGYTRRVFLVKSKLYFLEVKYKLENDFNTDIEHFLNTFSLLNTLDNNNPEKLLDKPYKNFYADFPGKTKSVENQIFDEIFGDIMFVSEIYELPDNLKDLPSTKNIAYVVSYAKLPKKILDTLSNERKQSFIIKALTDIATKQSDGKLDFQKEISFNGAWGYEGQVKLYQGMASMHLKAFVINDYYYQVIVMSKRGFEKNNEATKFFDSFKIILK
jgi:hypothetical protein